MTLAASRIRISFREIRESTFTEDDVRLVRRLEIAFFGGKHSDAPPETVAGIRAFLRLGGWIVVQFSNDHPIGCLELIEVGNLHAVTAEQLPALSTLRALVEHGAVRSLRPSDILVYGWISLRWRARLLIRILRRIPGRRITGFVLSSDVRANERYGRLAHCVCHVQSLYDHHDAHALYVSPLDWSPAVPGTDTRLCP
jgi:hypothetical protein